MISNYEQWYNYYRLKGLVMEEAMDKALEHCNMPLPKMYSLYELKEKQLELGKYSGFKQKDLNEVEHPKHYNSHPSGVECITVAQHYGFNLGNVFKYLWRCEEKGNALQDLKKAQFYLSQEIKKRSP